jgi:hypothetical protein
MPARNGHSSETTEAGGNSPQEPLIDRQLELDLLRQHIARATETGTGHAVLILDGGAVGFRDRPRPGRDRGRHAAKLTS